MNVDTFRTLPSEVMRAIIAEVPHPLPAGTRVYLFGHTQWATVVKYGRKYVYVQVGPETVWRVLPSEIVLLDES